MIVTLTIDEDLLHEAERATNIHDWSALVKKGLQALSQKPVRTEVTQAPFDFDAALAAAAELPDLSAEEFHPHPRRAGHWVFDSAVSQ